MLHLAVPNSLVTSESKLSGDLVEVINNLWSWGYKLQRWTNSRLEFNKFDPRVGDPFSRKNDLRGFAIVEPKLMRREPAHSNER